MSKLDQLKAPWCRLWLPDPWLSNFQLSQPFQVSKHVILFRPFFIIKSLSLSRREYSTRPSKSSLGLSLLRKPSRSACCWRVWEQPERVGSDRWLKPRLGHISNRKHWFQFLWKDRRADFCCLRSRKCAKQRISCSSDCVHVSHHSCLSICPQANAFFDSWRIDWVLCWGSCSGILSSLTCYRSVFYAAEPSGTKTSLIVAGHALQLCACRSRPQATVLLMMCFSHLSTLSALLHYPSASLYATLSYSNVVGSKSNYFGNSALALRLCDQ